MKNKKPEDMSVEELQSAKKTLTAVIMVPVFIMMIYVAFMIYLALNKRLGMNPALIAVPVALIGALMPASISRSKIDAELKKRRGIS